MIEDDIALAERLHEAAAAHPEIETIGRGLSIATFRFRPPDAGLDEAALSELNQALLLRLQTAGRYFLSNAVLDGRYVLRACVVNFRTTAADVDALPGYVAELGRDLLAQRNGA